MSLAQRHERFHDLHRSGCFVMPNPWDAGSARLMAAAGAVALGTTSAGYAFTLGRPDMGNVSRDEVLAHAEAIVSATPLPVSGDFENGFADDPDDVAETVRLAAQAGLSGCSIEDTTGTGPDGAYDAAFAAERIRAAVAAARSLGHPFVLCARADGVMNGCYDLDEALRRLRTFEEAGADLLYVPAPPGLDELRRILGAVSTPVNALAAGPLRDVAAGTFAEMGVRRISLGSTVARVTQKAVLDCMDAILNDGSFACLKAAASGGEIDRMLEAGAQGDGNG